MTTYLERYRGGECVPVWDELMARGDEAREEPLYSEALAVARETMRRARHNLELLIPRLRELGYIFGFTALGLEEELPAFSASYQTFAPPPADIAKRIAALERRAGTLPPRG